MNNEINQLYEIIKENNITGEEMTDLFLNFHGTTLVNSEFIEFISDEGYYIPK